MGKVRLCDTFAKGNMLCFKDYIAITGDKIIFSACNYNGLYQYNRENNQLSFLGNFIGENMAMKALHSKIVQYNQWYIFIPYYAKTIGIFDMESNSFSSMKLPLPKYACHSGAKFQMAEWYKDKLYLLPENYSYILEIDFTQNQFNMYDDWNEEKIIYQPNIETGFAMGWRDGERFVYLPLAGCNKIMKFDLESKEYEFISVKTECTGFRTLTSIESVFYATDENGKIIRFQKNGEKVKIIGEYGTKFWKSIEIEERYLVLFANDADAILVIDAKNEEQYFHGSGDTIDSGDYDNWEHNRLWFVKEVGNKKIAYMNREDRTIKIIKVNADKKICVSSKKVICDDTKNADYEIDIAEFYDLWLDYHNEVTRTLHYRKPFILSEKFSTEDTLHFIFNLLYKGNLQGKQKQNNKKEIGYVIWKGLKCI